MGRATELVIGPFRAAWRSGMYWSLGLMALVVSTVAFWPAMKGSSGITEAMEKLPPALISAFGLEGFGTPAGYLRGGLYGLLVPLLTAAAGIVFANNATAADEDAGRLEIYLAQPVSRRAFFVGRSTAVAVWLLVVAALLLVSQLISDAAFDLQINFGRLVATVALCALIGLLMAGLALAAAGIAGHPAWVLGIGFSVTFLSYLAAVLFPLSDALAPWSHLSPWDWALGGDPLVNGAEWWRYLAHAAPAVALATLGTLAFGQRDARSA